MSGVFVAVQGPRVRRRPPRQVYEVRPRRDRTRGADADRAISVSPAQAAAGRGLESGQEPPVRVEPVAANVPAPLNPEVVDPAPAAGNPFAAAPIQYVYVQAGASENTWGIIGLVVSMIGTLLTCGALSPVGLIISVAACFQKPRGAAIAGAVVGGVGSLWLATAGLSMILTFFSVQQAITGTAKSIEGTAKGVEGLTKSTEKLVDDASGVLKDPGKAVEDAKKSIDKAIGTQSKK